MIEKEVRGIYKVINKEKTVVQTVLGEVSLGFKWISQRIKFQ